MSNVWKNIKDAALLALGIGCILLMLGLILVGMFVEVTGFRWGPACA